MLDPKTNVAEQLADALRHHQKNMVQQQQAEQKAAVLQQMVDQLKEMSDGEDDAT